MAIDWTPKPPTDQPWAGTRLLRCPSAAPLAGLTMDCDLLGCRTHYAGGRTQPCQGASCPMCLDGHSWRWHGYLPLYNPTTGRQIILEIPALAAEDYHHQIEQYNTRAGLKLTVRRQNKRPNSRVILTLEPYPANGHVLPVPVDVRRYLEHMWGLDAEHPPARQRGTRRPNIRHTIPLNTPGESARPLHEVITEALDHRS